MMEQKYVDLMNQELDGVNSPSQSRKLAEYLESDPDARQYYLELQDALQIFQKVDLLEPPQGLLESVMSTIGASEPAWAARRPQERSGRGWLDFFRPARAVTFATGALFGLILFAGITQFNPGADDSGNDFMRGTATALLDSSPGSHLPRTIDLPGVRGQLRVLDRKNGTLVQLELESAGPVRIEIKHDEQLALEAFHATPPGRYELSAAGRSAEIAHTGSGEYYLLFSHLEGIDAEIEFLILAEGGSRDRFVVETE